MGIFDVGEVVVVVDGADGAVEVNGDGDCVAIVTLEVVETKDGRGGVVEVMLGTRTHPGVTGFHNSGASKNSYTVILFK